MGRASNRKWTTRARLALGKDAETARETREQFGRERKFKRAESKERKR